MLSLLKERGPLTASEIELALPSFSDRSLRLARERLVTPFGLVAKRGRGATLVFVAQRQNGNGNGKTAKPAAIDSNYSTSDCRGNENGNSLPPGGKGGLASLACSHAFETKEEASKQASSEDRESGNESGKTAMETAMAVAAALAEAHATIAWLRCRVDFLETKLAGVSLPEKPAEAVVHRDVKPENVPPTHHPANTRRAVNDDWPPPESPGIKRTLEEWVLACKESGKTEQAAETEFTGVRRAHYEFVVRALASYRIVKKREPDKVKVPVAWVKALIRDQGPFEEGTSENWAMNDETLAETPFNAPKKPKNNKPKDEPAGDTSWMSRL